MQANPVARLNYQKNMLTKIYFSDTMVSIFEVYTIKCGKSSKVASVVPALYDVL